MAPPRKIDYALAKAMLDGGETRREIARDMGVHEQTVGSALNETSRQRLLRYKRERYAEQRANPDSPCSDCGTLLPRYCLHVARAKGVELRCRSCAMRHSWQHRRRGGA